MIWRRVNWPEPLRPIRQTRSIGETDSSTPESSGVPPKVRRMSLSWMSGGAIGFLRSSGAGGTPSLHKWRAKAGPCKPGSAAYDGLSVAPSNHGSDMTSTMQTYRVSAYNTAKQAENKMHNDAVARRFGFSGGLVPGVDVMAYMMHLPVARWGRPFLERGLLEARFVEPVYDGEDVDLTARERDGVLELEVESRGEICATGSASLPATAPPLSLADYKEIGAVAERRPVSALSFERDKWLGTTPRAWAGEAAKDYLADIRETDPIYLREGL